jgi:hypothetical protein
MFLQGIQRILNCAKVQVAATGLASTWLAVHYAAADLPPTQRSALWIAFIGAVAVQLREIINAWTEEDVTRISAQAAQLQNNEARGTKGPGDEGTKGAARASSAPYPSSLSPSVPSSLIHSPISPRSTTMPPRTKLPLILLAFTTITMLVGCQTCPELAVYRDGLHQIDEPLYQAHLLLMNDAVKAGIRADADRQVVQQGIAAARALYQQAATTQPAQTAGN